MEENTNTFKPSKKEPVFRLHISNDDPNIKVDQHHVTYGGITRFGVLITPRNPLDMSEMRSWLKEQGMPVDVEDCSEFGAKHPNGIFIYNKQINTIEEQDYIYFVDVRFVPREGSGINYPEVMIVEGYKY